MANIIAVSGKKPHIGDNVFLAPSAILIGEVSLGNQVSIWFNTVVRGDVNAIVIGDETNVQDGTVIHGTYQKSDVKIGKRVSIGHSAIIHGCEIHDHVLVGMGAKILDDAIIEEEVFVAAGSLVGPGKILEKGYLYAGVPARKIRTLDDNLLQVIYNTPDNYIKYKSWY